MNCIECKAANPDGNRFCGQCGAELGRTLEDTVRRKGVRDRRAIEIEITESVVSRLMKWARWLGGITAVIVALFGLLLGKSYYDIRTAVGTGKSEISSAVQQGKTEIDTVRQTITGLKEQVAEVQQDTNRYKQVNTDIEKLQKQLMAVQNQIIDFGRRGLRANSFEATAPGPGYFEFGIVGCPTVAPEKGFQVVYCAKGSPLSLFQVTSAGDVRPVSSLSPIGFQDASIAAKPTCATTNRGTFYVEKGAGNVADKPFLCTKKSDNTYAWIQLGMIP
jgi:hypothetical protein